jgi:hypothetical protein
MTKYRTIIYRVSAGIVTYHICWSVVVSDFHWLSFAAALAWLFLLLCLRKGKRSDMSQWPGEHLSHEGNAQKAEVAKLSAGSHNRP